MIATIQAQINNSNVTVSTRDVMSALLKLYNYEELAIYNSLTPSLVDSFYQNYADGLGTNNNVLANYSVGTFSKQFQPRGCFPVKLFQVKQDGTAGDAIAGLSIKASAATPEIPAVPAVPADNTTTPPTPAIPAVPAVPANAGGTAPFASFIIRFTTTEPLLF